MLVLAVLSSVNKLFIACRALHPTWALHTSALALTLMYLNPTSLLSPDVITPTPALDLREWLHLLQSLLSLIYFLLHLIFH